MENYMYILPDVRTADVKGKRVFLRADLDVPLSELRTTNSEQRTIEDDTRLKAWFPTLEYLLEHNATVMIGGKLGRPGEESGIRNQELSMRPVAEWLCQELKVQSEKLKVTKLGGFGGWKIGSNVVLLENLQFYPEEKANDPEFAEKLASLADAYVNDAFAVCHRSRASVVGVPKLLPHFAGLRLQEEVRVMSSILENPKRPFVVIVGGAKVETKVPLVSKMVLFADWVLVGGKTAGAIALEHERLIVAKLNREGTDIAQESTEKFREKLKGARTIVWNGPVGKVQSEKLKVKSERDTETGTREIAQAIVQSLAYKVVGGGDTIGFLHSAHLLDKFDFVSTGGGAMLAFLSGETLPGLEVLLS